MAHSPWAVISSETHTPIALSQTGANPGPGENSVPYWKVEPSHSAAPKNAVSSNPP